MKLTHATGFQVQRIIWLLDAASAMFEAHALFKGAIAVPVIKMSQRFDLVKLCRRLRVMSLKEGQECVFVSRDLLRHGLRGVCFRRSGTSSRTWLTARSLAAGTRSFDAMNLRPSTATAV